MVKANGQALGRAPTLGSASGSVLKKN